MPVSLCIDLDTAQRDSLLATARHSITAGFDREIPVAVDLEEFESLLVEPFAVFVTLLQSGALRGCIGSLEASQPLIQAVATSAYNAAFRDRRFRRLQVAELDQTQIEISVLSPMEPIVATGRQSLLEQLEPGVDGLLLEDRGRRATFLPKVWEKIEAGEDFVGQLMLKAGLPATHWSESVRCYRYRTLTFAEK
jgi:AmmeMemoRadiSam system protein A